MVLIKADMQDYNRVTAFYKHVIDNAENMEIYGRWIYGQHPTDEMLKGYMEEGYMYYAEDEGEMIAAAAVTPFQGEDYHPVKWGADLKDDEVMVVHILCVDPRRQRCGLAKKVMGEIIDMTKRNNKKAIRLDALCCNQPAHRLYEAMGFKKCGIQNWFASNTGWIDFFLYEYICQ